MDRLIIFTDLDGTLLDSSTYSFEKARPALELVKKREIPLVTSAIPGILDMLRVAVDRDNQ